MSTEYSAVTVIGYMVDAAEFVRPLLKKVKEESHMEKRYSTKTGKEIEPEKVIDQEEGFVIVIDGKNVVKFESDAAKPKDVKDDELYSQVVTTDLTDVLADKLDCDVGIFGDHEHGSMFWLYFQPNNLKTGDDGGYRIEDVCAAKKEIDRIGRAIRDMDLDPGNSGIFSDVDAG